MKQEKKIANIGENVKTLEYLYPVGKNIKWCSHYRKYMEFPQKRTNRTII
jgi:hypothetical protein